MRVKNLFRILTPLVVACALCVVAPDFARAQGSAAPNASAAPPAAAKFDEFGDLRHCDWSARVDNLAVEIQRDPKAKAFVVSYNARGKKQGYAGRQLKIARHYLVHVRGVSPERVVAVDGGEQDIAEGRTQLWVVPEGAQPPVAAPAVDKYAAKDFSGKFDSYVTDGRTYKVMMEMGYSDEEIAYSEFAEKLKEQPGSVGYLVVRVPVDAISGDWRRVGRRDEQIITKDYGVEAARLKTLNGGQSKGEYSEVEFWILPNNAPPPASYAEELTRIPKAAVRLNRFDSYGALDKDAERWILENLAELLRDNPRATACLVTREQLTSEEEEREPGEQSEGEPGGESGGKPDEESDGEPGEELKSVNQLAAEFSAELFAEHEESESAEAEGAEAEGVEVEEEITGSASVFAERWKDILINKYGIEARRVVVLEGKPMDWSGVRVTTWLVPENAPLPDPFARDEDDPEVEVLKKGDDDKETAASPPPS